MKICKIDSEEGGNDERYFSRGRYFQIEICKTKFK